MSGESGGLWWARVTPLHTFAHHITTPKKSLQIFVFFRKFYFLTYLRLMVATTFAIRIRFPFGATATTFV